MNATLIAVLLAGSVTGPGRKDLELTMPAKVAADPVPWSYLYTEAECVEAVDGICEHSGHRPDVIVRWTCEVIRGTLYTCNQPWPMMSFVHIEDYSAFFHQRRADLHRQGVAICDGEERECRKQGGFGAPLVL